MKNLLVPVDFSDATTRVVMAAEQLATAFRAKIWLLHCVGDNPATGIVGEIPMYMPAPDTPLPVMFPDAHRELVELTASLLNKGIDAEEIFVSGAVIDAIQTAADQYQVDLIIVGSHGHGAFYELLVGTVTKAVLQRVGRPTLIIPSGSPSTQKWANSRRWELQETAAD